MWMVISIIWVMIEPKYSSSGTPKGMLNMSVLSDRLFLQCRWLPTGLVTEQSLSFWLSNLWLIVVCRYSFQQAPTQPCYILPTFPPGHTPSDWVPANWPCGSTVPGSPTHVPTSGLTAAIPHTAAATAAQVCTPPKQPLIQKQQQCTHTYTQNSSSLQLFTYTQTKKLHTVVTLYHIIIIIYFFLQQTDTRACSSQHTPGTPRIWLCPTHAHSSANHTTAQISGRGHRLVRFSQIHTQTHSNMHIHTSPARALISTYCL